MSQKPSDREDVKPKANSLQIFKLIALNNRTIQYPELSILRFLHSQIQKSSPEVHSITSYTNILIALFELWKVNPHLTQNGQFQNTLQIIRDNLRLLLQNRVSYDSPESESQEEDLRSSEASNLIKLLFIFSKLGFKHIEFLEQLANSLQIGDFLKLHEPELTSFLYTVFK